MALGTFAIGTGEFAIMGMLPEMASSLDVSVPVAGHIISAYALGVVVGAPLIAVAGARLPRRTLLMVLMAVFVVGNVLAILSPGYRTLEGMRFLTGLPHGAFFGVAALVAASLVDRAHRGRAVGRVMAGLTVSSVLGAPFATWGGEFLGWRLTYALIGVLGVASLLLIVRNIPADPPHPGASPLRELGALRRSQVWFTLATGAVGFGGMFCVYTYLSDVLINVSGYPAYTVPLVQALWGVGMVAGNLIGARLVDVNLNMTVILAFVWSMVTLCLFYLTASSPWVVTPVILLLGGIIALVPALQTRLMDVAADAQTLAASLNHSAFNVANALGAWLGGVVIAAGQGEQAVGWAGAMLSAGGLVIFLAALAAQTLRRRAAAAGA
ncbi:MFS transporter [Gluconacetobacter johannae]|uniref:MFS transporter n=1 Tax=Gluconacetobacter johannae TaxID=112140 RepID=A0A7W4P417_9PROT|nr:MFS transporter [Gluconacetobacter johannae]